MSLARPQVRNAFDAETVARLREAFAGLGADTSVRAVVLRGEGPVFSAGADLGWMRRMAGAGRRENERDALALGEMFAAVRDCPVPVIAAVQGAAMGGGLGLVAACDHVVAEAKCRFALPEVRLGLVPAVISPLVLEKIGLSQARSLFVSGRSFDAEFALRIGLVHEVARGMRALKRQVEEMVADILRGGPRAVREAKALALSVGTRTGHEKNLRACAKTIARLRASDEGREGISAMLEKRAPRWRGKEG